MRKFYTIESSDPEDILDKLGLKYNLLSQEEMEEIITKDFLRDLRLQLGEMLKDYLEQDLEEYHIDCYKMEDRAIFHLCSVPETAIIVVF